MQELKFGRVALEKSESRKVNKIGLHYRAELKLLLLPRLRVNSNIIGKVNIAEHFGKFDIEESRLRYCRVEIRSEFRHSDREGR